MNINTKINRIPNNLKILLNNYLGNNDGKSSLEWLKKLIKQLIKIKTFNIDIK